MFWQSAGGFLIASLATSFFVAFCEFYELKNVPRPVTIVIAAFVLLIFAVHAVAKFMETEREAHEDQEEITQIDSIKQDLPEIKPARELPEFLKHAAFRPLYWLLGGNGAVRPGMRRVSWFSFFYGLVVGTAITLFLLGTYHVLHHTPLWILKHLQIDELKDWMIVAMVVNVAIAAMLQWYTEKRAFGSHYRQYKKMKTTFLVAYNALHPRNAGKDVVAPQMVLTRLGIEVLAEHADWLLMYRELLLELPKLEPDLSGLDGRWPVQDHRSTMDAVRTTTYRRAKTGCPSRGGPCFELSAVAGRRMVRLPHPKPRARPSPCRGFAVHDQ